MQQMKYTEIKYLGRNITDLTIMELYKVIEVLYEDNNKLRTQYEQATRDTIDMMDAAINAKKRSL